MPKLQNTVFRIVWKKTIFSYKFSGRDGQKAILSELMRHTSRWELSSSKRGWKSNIRSKRRGTQSLYGVSQASYCHVSESRLTWKMQFPSPCIFWRRKQHNWMDIPSQPPSFSTEGCFQWLGCPSCLMSVYYAESSSFTFFISELRYF